MIKIIARSNEVTSVKFRFKSNLLKKTIQILFLLAISVNNINCRSKDKIHEVSVNIDSVFTKKYITKGRTIISSKNLIDPWTILAMDSLLIIGNKKGEPAIEIYNTNGTIIKKIISRGVGDNNVLFIGQLQSDYLNKCFYCYDLFNKKILKISLEDFPIRDSLTAKLLIDFKNSILPKDLYDKMYVMGKYFIGESKSLQGRLLLVNKKSLNLNFQVNYPQKIDSTLSDKEFAHLYGSCIAISPNKNNLAIATFNAGLLNLYDISNPLKFKSLWNYNDFFPNNLKKVTLEDSTNLMMFTDQSKSGYSDICATDNFVYAVYSGKYMGEKKYSFSNIIRVISWDGKKKFELLLDREVNRISIDKNNSCIYGITSDLNNEPEVVEFTIKNIVNKYL